MIRFKVPRSGQMSPAARFYLINERVILGGFMIVIVNLLIDILYAVIDPRIRLES